jgi:hypothetical protein
MALLLITMLHPWAAFAAEGGPASQGAPEFSAPSARPEGGEWFTFELGPGSTASTPVLIDNRGSTPARVRLSLADLDFDEDDLPTIAEPATDVGTWGSFDVAELDVPAQSTRRVLLTMRVPAGSDPGDHIGAVVVESVVRQAGGEGGVGVAARVATRLYVTVPGDARAAVEIKSTSVKRQRGVVPRWADVAVVVRNTGTVRVSPTVTVGGRRATGPDVLLSRAAERYVARVPVPVWGGSRSWAVRVSTRIADGAGPTATGRASITVFPWVPLAVLLIALQVLGTLWYLRRRRQRHVRDLAAEVERLQAELSREHAGPRPGGR